MEKSRFDVVVSNIGTVATGDTFLKVYKTYLEYTRMSEGEDGLAAGEDVTLFKDGEIVREYQGRFHDYY